MVNTIADMHVREGMRRGELRAARNLLVLLLQDRFGPIPEALAQQIEATEDLTRLQNCVLQATKVKNLSEFTL